MMSVAYGVNRLRQAAAAEDARAVILNELIARVQMPPDRRSTPDAVSWNAASRSADGAAALQSALKAVRNDRAVVSLAVIILWMRSASAPFPNKIGKLIDSNNVCPITKAGEKKLL